MLFELFDELLGCAVFESDDIVFVEEIDSRCGFDGVLHDKFFSWFVQKISHLSCKKVGNESGYSCQFFIFAKDSSEFILRTQIYGVRETRT